MRIASIYEKWGKLDSKSKMMAVGTIALVVASICLSFSNCSSLIGERSNDATGAAPSITIEEGVIIPSDAEPIPLATEETQLVTSLIEILSKEECQWRATDDEWCALEFNGDRFTEYNGDIAKSGTVAFYSIEAIESGRQGTWRVTYDDGSIIYASFQFIQNRERGVYALTSEAFPTCKTYQTNAITSEDVLAW